MWRCECVRDGTAIGGPLSGSRSMMQGGERCRWCWARAAKEPQLELGRNTRAGVSQAQADGAGRAGLVENQIRLDARTNGDAQADGDGPAACMPDYDTAALHGRWEAGKQQAVHRRLRFLHTQSVFRNGPEKRSQAQSLCGARVGWLACLLAGLQIRERGKAELGRYQAGNGRWPLGERYMPPCL